MNKTKIEWCDYTWNPATGCLHGCPYCYAKRNTEEHGGNFNPLFHESRLIQPKGVKKPQNIFVGSMTDLFGNWFSDEQIEKVFEACNEAPQHRYLFLTKNPTRYEEYFKDRIMPDNYWFGTTVTNDRTKHFWSNQQNTFISIEPIQSYFKELWCGMRIDWVIIGAETGNRKEKIIPKRNWIEAIVEYCRHHDIPVFLKNNLASIWKQPLIQEYPWKNEEPKDEINGTDRVFKQEELFN